MTVQTQRTLSIAFALVIVSAGTVHSAGAQTLHVAADAQVMLGNGNGSGYSDGSLAGYRFAVSVETPIAKSRLGVYADASYDVWAPDRDYSVICDPLPGGSCSAPYPHLRGPAATIGLAISLSPAMKLRAGIGGGRYHDERQDVNAVIGNLDFAYVIQPSLALVIGARRYTSAKYYTTTLSANALVLGLRVL